MDVGEGGKGERHERKVAQVKEDEMEGREEQVERRKENHHHHYHHLQPLLIHCRTQAFPNVLHISLELAYSSLLLRMLLISSLFSSSSALTSTVHTLLIILKLSTSAIRSTHGMTHPSQPILNRH